MRKWGLIVEFSVILIAAGVIADSPAGAQNFRSTDQCMQALSSKCMKLMDPQAKRSCFQGNKVYCQRFDRKPEIKPEDKPFSESIPRSWEDREVVTPRDARELKQKR